MLKKLISRIYKQQKGITGLETAIILIAFVVVAAVFAYTVLSAGLFSTQKSQEAVYSGLKTAQSTVELKGGVIALGTGGSVTNLTFTLALAAGGDAMDFTPPSSDTNGIANGNNVVTISYIDKNQRVDNLYWTFAPLGANDGTNLLSAGEKFQITIGGAFDHDLVRALSPDLTANNTFTIEIKTPQGAVMTIERTNPAVIAAVNNLN